MTSPLPQENICGVVIHVGFDGATTCANPKPCWVHNEDGSWKRPEEVAQKEPRGRTPSTEEILLDPANIRKAAEKSNEMQRAIMDEPRGKTHKTAMEVQIESQEKEYYASIRAALVRKFMQARTIAVIPSADYEVLACIAAEHFAAKDKWGTCGTPFDHKHHQCSCYSSPSPHDDPKGWEERFEQFMVTLPSRVGETPRTVLKSFITSEIERAYERGFKDGFDRENVEIITSGFSELEQKTIRAAAQRELLERIKAEIKKIHLGHTITPESLRFRIVALLDSIEKESQNTVIPKT